MSECLQAIIDLVLVLLYSKSTLTEIIIITISNKNWNFIKSCK